MAQALFTTGFTHSEVVAIQTRAKTLLLEGKTVMSWSVSGASASKQFVLPIKEVLEECKFALDHPHLLDDAPQRKRAKTTARSGFSGYLEK